MGNYNNDVVLHPCRATTESMLYCTMWNSYTQSAPIALLNLYVNTPPIYPRPFRPTDRPPVRPSARPSTRNKAKSRDSQASKRIEQNETKPCTLADRVLLKKVVCLSEARLEMEYTLELLQSSQIYTDENHFPHQNRIICTEVIYDIYI